MNVRHTTLALVAALALTGTPAFAQEAAAADSGGLMAVSPPATMTCTAQAGQPSLSRSGNNITYTYAHTCNTLSGVTDMVEVNSLEVADGEGKAAGRRGEVTRYEFNTGTRFSSVYDMGAPGGWWNARMDLTLRGTFSFGSVAGCGRVNATTVTCTFRSARTPFY